eukprot:1153767-Pelagomonas_calceolata.AAC.1
MLPRACALGTITGALPTTANIHPAHRNKIRRAEEGRKSKGNGAQEAEAGARLCVIPSTASSTPDKPGNRAVDRGITMEGVTHCQTRPKQWSSSIILYAAHGSGDVLCYTSQPFVLHPELMKS